jgi:long-chain acyl-CoA synthetase
MTMTPTTVLYHRVKKSPRNVAFIRDNESWTYERLATQVDRLARGLIEHGVGKGDRVALHMANLPELVIAYHACFRVGAIAAPFAQQIDIQVRKPGFIRFTYDSIQFNSLD